MKYHNRMRLAGLATTGLLLTSSVSLHAQTTDIEARALERLQAMSSYLANQQSISVDTENTLEIVLEDGQKLQFDNTVMMTAQRPNKLLAVRTGDLVNQQLYYDGQTLTLRNPDDGVYATIAAPDTLEAMLDYARETLDIVAPAGDLLYSNAFGILTADISSGFMVGTTLFNDVSCDHFAFRGIDTDWQIWIRTGTQPLPCKMVITSREVLNAPQFVVKLSNWNFDAKPSDHSFQFNPDDDDLAIEFLLLNATND